MIIPGISKNQRLLLRFLLGWLVMVILDTIWGRRSILGSVIYGFFFSLIMTGSDSMIERDYPTAYTRLKYEDQVMEKVEKLGFTFARTKNGRQVYTKPGTFRKEKLRIEKNAHHLKVMAAEKHMDEFEAFV